MSSQTPRHPSRRSVMHPPQQLFSPAQMMTTPARMATTGANILLAHTTDHSPNMKLQDGQQIIATARNAESIQVHIRIRPTVDSHQIESSKAADCVQADSNKSLLFLPRDQRL